MHSHEGKEPRSKLRGILGGPDYFVVRVAEGDRKRFSALPEKINRFLHATRVRATSSPDHPGHKSLSKLRGIQPKEIKKVVAAGYNQLLSKFAAWLRPYESRNV